MMPNDDLVTLWAIALSVVNYQKNTWMRTQKYFNTIDSQNEIVGTPK